MTGVDQIDAQILSVPELIVLHIRSDEGIASRLGSLGQLRSTGTAAHSHPPHRLPAVAVSQAGAVQVFLYPCQKSFQGLLLHPPGTEQAHWIAGWVGAGGKQNLHILQSQHPGQHIVYPARRHIQIGMSVDSGNPIGNQRTDASAGGSLVGDGFQGRENQRVMCHDQIRSQFRRFLTDSQEGVQGHQYFGDRQISASAQKPHVVPAFGSASRSQGFQVCDDVFHIWHRKASYSSAAWNHTSRLSGSRLLCAR